ncbi:hypothetical protein [Phaeospirillum tilakii]|uniref:Phage r1t holin n=1 Tax=Phaeospirillum tilakii TaxID=741673 RepID=A0ABW5CDT5_9PROT
MSRLSRWLEARLSERSTWVGLGGALATGLATVGSYLDPVTAKMIAAAVIAAGAVAAVMPSGGTSANPPPAGPSDGPADPAQP